MHDTVMEMRDLKEQNLQLIQFAVREVEAVVLNYVEAAELSPLLHQARLPHQVLQQRREVHHR